VCARDQSAGPIARSADRVARGVSMAHRGRVKRACLGLALIVAASVWLAAPRGGGDDAHLTVPLASATASAGPVATVRPAAPRPRRAAAPVRLEIAAIGVRAPVIRLGLNRDGTLEVPARFDEVGWWAGGARPGERGPAVIAGHVDSRTGPAVFFRLDRLRSRDAIVVVRRDGSRVRFVVQRIARYRKAAFPTARVYGPTRAPALRLITCSGAFDAASGHYVDNTVVYARPA
jgi:Sortase domain